jgi:hypothetical protein
VDNAWIADRLEAFASLLDLADANPYMPRAYRRAAETIRSAAVPVAGLVASGRVRELRGIGPGIEGRLRELVETGEIAELAELERELSPELVGLGRYLGLGATRSLQIARALGVRTPGELREAAAAGRLRTVPGIGPKREAPTTRRWPTCRFDGTSSTRPTSTGVRQPARRARPAERAARARAGHRPTDPRAHRRTRPARRHAHPASVLIADDATWPAYEMLLRDLAGRAPPATPGSCPVAPPPPSCSAGTPRRSRHRVAPYRPLGCRRPLSVGAADDRMRSCPGTTTDAGEAVAAGRSLQPMRSASSTMIPSGPRT